MGLENLPTSGSPLSETMESALLAPPYRPLGEVTKLGFLQLSKQITRGFRELAFRLLQSHNSVLLLPKQKTFNIPEKNFRVNHFALFSFLPAAQ